MIVILSLFCLLAVSSVVESFNLDRKVFQPHDVQIERLMNRFKNDDRRNLRSAPTTTSGIPNCEGGGDKDRINQLPGYSNTNLPTMYSGFIEVNATANGSLFYWFIKSQDKLANENTPVLVWLNGGPGASSLTGLFMENGPFRIKSDGALELHNSTWNKYYHMLFIDNPIGTGFSFCNNDSYVTNNEQMAEDFLVMLQTFFTSTECHREYRENPLYITGESYAGRYIPFIAKWIQSNDTKGLNLKGLAIGNGIYDPTIQFASGAEYAYHLGILDQQGRDQVLQNVTAAWNMINSNGPSKAATQILLDSTNNIYGNDTSLSYGGNIFQYNFYIRDPNYFNGLTDQLAAYLMQEAISNDIHTHGIPWKSSDGTSSPNPVDDALYLDIVMNNSAIFIPDLLKSYRILFYNGQLDGSICNNFGNQLCLQQLNYQGNWYFRPRKVWKNNNGGKMLTAGYVKQSEDKKLTYVVISDSGHLVPFDQPDNSLQMIKTFIEDGEW